MSVLLKKDYFEKVSNKELVQQLEAKKKCAKKLPLWHNTPKIYYPKKLHIEQTSSEITARFKANLIGGEMLLDLTTGLGVDAYYFSKKFHRLILCEINEELSLITKYNLELLGILNAIVLSKDGIALLKNTKEHFDWIYADPARRHESKGKVFKLADCSPNIPENLDLLYKKTRHILIKTSPLLDLSIGIKELSGVKIIHILAVNNEVKELLWLLEKDYSQEIQIICTNIKKETEEVFEFSIKEETDASSVLSTPLSYLYEPNSAILKGGAFRSIGQRFQLKKLQEHTHLFTSDELVEFPGRVFKILAIHPYHKKIAQIMGLSKANITIRNFPESVDKIRKKTKIQDGGKDYLFFIRDQNQALQVLHCAKLF